MNRKYVGALALLTVVVALGCSRKSVDSGEFAADPLALPAETVDDGHIVASIDHPERFSGDSDEDVWRQPRDVLLFLGVRADMDVLDYFAGSGYYTELLSRAVGPNGSVVAYNNPGYAEFAGDKFVKRFANQRLANAKTITAPTDQLKLESQSLDAVLFVLSYHDLYWQPKEATQPFGNPAQALAGLHRALRNDGVVVVVDHAAAPGGDTAQVVDALHRIDPQVVKDDFAKAGFEFVEESNALSHPNDDLQKPVFDPTVRHNTHQFTFKFRKRTDRL